MYNKAALYTRFKLNLDIINTHKCRDACTSTAHSPAPPPASGTATCSSSGGAGRFPYFLFAEPVTTKRV